MSIEPLKLFVARVVRQTVRLAKWAWPIVRVAALAVRELAAHALRAPALRRVGMAFWRLCGVAGGLTTSGARVAVTAITLAVLTLAPLFLFTKRVHAGLVGVKQAQWGGGGVAPRDYTPGLRASVRGWHTWHLLDGRTHFLSFGYETDGAEFPILDLRTRDGNVVKVGVTVPYRIRPGEAHLIVGEGLKSSYPNMVRATTENLLVQELAELTSSDFADTDLRRARMDAALPRLNELLAPFHVEAESIQINQVFFWMSYETKLQAKQLTRQNALLAEAVTQVEEEKRADTLTEEIVAEEKKIRAEMDLVIERERAATHARVERVKRDAQEYTVARHAEADATYQRELATGRLALDRAEAVRDELVQAALETPGGRLFLARQAATKLNIRSVTLDSGDPSVPSVLDLDEMVKLLVGDADG